ncbi:MULTISPECIES: NAD(P)-dependent oxidoreductase [unclassified Streptomyces]|uniref:NAD(P)-dependent oxidoreductase n=1 Tax=unclassified Streptomyces TaxID=2593676 RepID=UPI0029BC05AA|nr:MULTISPECIES: NAD(P)-dependent oxidoreductase [unclassified Streptomyces]MDX3767880.1 NAD(P)-dependent oxidoreductase [Streptomyces sp. AK08-01B]MDX3818107.1 NAD(P)-dependent oxidoreductase [Streptomyces sp. AK08-01A]
MSSARILILDSAPEAFLSDELEPFLAAGIHVTLNLWRLERRETVREALANRVDFVDFSGFDEQALISEVTEGGRGYDIVKTRANVPITRRFLTAATRDSLQRPLRVVAQAGSGTNHIDVSAAVEHRVLVTHTPGSNAEAVAEHALAMIMVMTKELLPHHGSAHQGLWRGHPVSFPRELSELTLGIVGPGLIGQALARKAQTLGMTVVALGSRRFDADQAVRIGVDRAGSLAELLAVSDIVSLHCPLNDSTRGMIGPDELRLMKPASVLVNVARGGVVDEEALASALKDPDSAPAAAAVDVFAKEHEHFASPLMGLDNAFLTPHIAGMTHGAAARATSDLTRNILALLAGRREGVPVVGPGTE